jgi:predicted PurR-regulated permease PerM
MIAKGINTFSPCGQTCGLDESLLIKEFQSEKRISDDLFSTRKLMSELNASRDSQKEHYHQNVQECTSSSEGKRQFSKNLVTNFSSLLYAMILIILTSFFYLLDTGKKTNALHQEMK